MKLDPRHLELLSAIVDNGGLTEGADALGKAQPSVSRTVSMLEARVGAPLFEKSRRPLVPTELCLALAVEGRKILAANKSASTIVASYQGGRRGVVRLGGTPVFMDGVISAMIPQFQASFPEVRIEQSYGYSNELRDRLDNNTLDLAICPLNPTTVGDGFEFVPVLQGRNVIACGYAHRLLAKPSIRLSDIANYPWIAPPTSSPLYQDMRQVLADIGIRDFKVSFSGGSLTATINILNNSDALTVLPYSVVFMARRQKTLAALSIRIGHPERSLGLLRSKAAPKRPSVERFSRFVANEFASLSATITKHEQNNLWRD
ncbi:MAG: LysR family transcriptional regulator [Nitratireductor sp.]|nr:LysR family transcriptional regulator [Nitratireductor sp.]